MQGKPQDYMKVGIIHFMVYPGTMKGEGPIVEGLREIADDGYFQLVEVTHVNDPVVRRQAMGLAKERGLDVGYGCQPVLLTGKLDLNSSDEADRKKAIGAVKQNIEEAYEWNASAFGVLSGPDPGPAQRRKAADLLADSLSEICEHSARLGSMPILLETFDRLPFGKNCLVGPTEEGVAVAKKVRRNNPSFGLLLDLSHLPLLSESASHMLGVARDYIGHIHIGNCVMRHPEHLAYGDNHPMFGIPEGENGAPELAEFLGELVDIGYISKNKKGTVSFEIKPFGSQTARDVLKNARETLDEAWKLLQPRSAS